MAKTDFVRSDIEVKVIEFMAALEAPTRLAEGSRDITPDEMEQTYRGRPSYEAAIRAGAKWLEQFRIDVRG